MIPITKHDRIKLRMAYRRLHLAAGNCLPIGWHESIDYQNGELAEGGCDPTKSPVIANVIHDFRGGWYATNRLDDSDVVTSVAVWCWQLSNGATISELRGRINRAEDYMFANQCQLILDLIVRETALIVNNEITPYLRKMNS